MGKVSLMTSVWERCMFKTESTEYMSPLEKTFSTFEKLVFLFFTITVVSLDTFSHLRFRFVLV